MNKDLIYNNIFQGIQLSPTLFYKELLTHELFAANIFLMYVVLETNANNYPLQLKCKGFEMVLTLKIYTDELIQDSSLDCDCDCGSDNNYDSDRCMLGVRIT